MKHQARHSQKQEQAAELQSQHQAGREFETPDELLRFDAASTAVPPEVIQRLQKSAEILTPEPRPWWKKILGF